MSEGSGRKEFCDPPVYVHETQPATHSPTTDVPVLKGHTFLGPEQFVQSFGDPPEHSRQLESHSIYIYIYIYIFIYIYIYSLP